MNHVYNDSEVFVEFSKIHFIFIIKLNMSLNLPSIVFKTEK